MEREVEIQAENTSVCHFSDSTGRLCLASPFLNRLGYKFNVSDLGCSPIISHMDGAFLPGPSELVLYSNFKFHFPYHFYPRTLFSFLLALGPSSLSLTLIL